jgi:hypothetical protein
MLNPKWLGHMAQVAERHTVPVVYSYGVLNGSNGGEQVPAEILQADRLHFKEKGQRLLADLHRELGYEPLAP